MCWVYYSLKCYKVIISSSGIVKLDLEAGAVCVRNIIVTTNKCLAHDPKLNTTQKHRARSPPSLSSSEFQFNVFSPVLCFRALLLSLFFGNNFQFTNKTSTNVFHRCD